MGMNSPKVVKSVQKVFSIKEICHIIQVCHKNDVSDLRLGEFSLSFHTNLREPDSGSVTRRRSKLPKSETVYADDRSELDEKTYVSVSQKEYEAAQMLIDDPVAFENAEIDAAMGIDPN